MIDSLQKLIAQKQLFLNLIQGIGNDGNPEYYYLAVRGDDMLRLHNALKDADDYGFEPTDYGLIIEGGRGEEPSASVKERMEKEYGYSHEKAIPIILNDQYAA